MMSQFFKKWSAALVFAILLHLGVFFLFYINSYENRTDNIANSQEFIEDTTMRTNIEKDYLSTMTQAQVATLNTAEKDYEIDNVREKNLDMSQESISKTKEKMPSKSLKVVNITPTYPLKMETISNKNLQENNNILENVRNIDVEPSIFSNEDLADVKDDVGLLNIDTPTRSLKPKIDSNYDLIKSEIEETNDQLSDAINEVKKRNQQKIDKIQQQNKYIHNSESNDLAIGNAE